MMRAPKISQNIVILIDSFGFPYGMAATQRVRLIARALVENGFQVKVMVIRALEKKQNIENSEFKGTFQGIDFEYSSGTTIRSRNFFVRHFTDIKGIVVAMLLLAKYRVNKNLDCFYYYGNMYDSTINRWLFYLEVYLLGIPLIIELCERPWTFEHKTIMDCLISPLTNVSGVIVISPFLKSWASKEALRIKRSVRFLELPILVDANEESFTETSNSSEPIKVLYAAAPQYPETIEFILESMIFVWDDFPDCQLLITGHRDDLSLNKIKNKITQLNLQKNVQFTGYVPRMELLGLYKSATCLLIPLFEDIRSRARFPTKIGEYLCSGRPVITTDVGDITNYLQDGVNALICKPGDPKEYARKIIKGINPENQEQNRQIGLNGRTVARTCFHYRNYSNSITDFFSSFCS